MRSGHSSRPTASNCPFNPVGRRLTRSPHTRWHLRANRVVPSVLLTLALLCGVPPAAHAQAWLSPAGEGTIGLSFEYDQFQGHLGSSGETIPLGPSTARSLLLAIDYSISDRWAVSGALPYVSTRNDRDPSPVAGRTGIDDGNFHSTFQDYHFEVRYALLRAPLVTPFLRYVTPSHNYQTEAEAAPGRRLHQLLAGAYVGSMLDPLLPDAYVQALVSYAWVEKSLGISTNRVNVDLTLGYIVTSAFGISLLGNYQKTYGGLTGDEVFGGGVSPELFDGHDRLLRDNHWRVGIGASYALSLDWSVNAALGTLVSGTNTHYGNTYALTVQRRFEFGRP